jgi:hypothetical protein
VDETCLILKLKLQIYLKEFRLFGLINLKLSCDASKCPGPGDACVDEVAGIGIGIIDEAATAAAFS